jgi:hypothetical protein
MFGLGTKTPAPAGANTPLASGPVIATPHPDQVPILRPDAGALAAEAPPDRCIRRGCGGKLGVRGGIVKVDGGNGVAILEDSYRCRRQSYIACQRCGTTVPVNHPMQVKLDADWQAQDAKDKAEAERLAKRPPAPAAQPINSALSMPDAIQALCDRLERRDAEQQQLVYRLAAMEKRVIALEKALGERD